MKKLSKRLTAVSNFVKKKSVIVDVGTDHGLIPIYLVQTGIVTKAIASDIVESICINVEKEVTKEKLSDKIKVIHSDGLKNIKDRNVDTIIIAGMGGLLICEILKARKKYIEDKTLILSPHRDVDKLRRFLHKIGFKITKEDIVEDKEGKFYFIIEAKNGEDKEYTDLEYALGKKLIKTVKENRAFKEYLKFEINKINKNIERMVKGKNTEEQVSELEKVRKNYEKILMKG